MRLVETHRPDVVLMDIAMPLMDGIQATRTIKAAHPEVNVIALTTFQDPGQVTAALGAGASGYLLKDVEPEVLVAGIRASVRGGASLSPSVAAKLRRRGISEKTVKAHCSSLFRRLGVTDRTQAAIWATHNLPAINDD